MNRRNVFIAAGVRTVISASDIPRSTLSEYGLHRTSPSQDLPYCASQASELADIAVFEQFARRVRETYDDPNADRCAFFDNSVLI